MFLHYLPPELILLLATFLTTQRDINSLSQTNRYLYSLLNPYLYKIDAQESNTALFWGSQHGNEETFRKCLQAGANVQATDRGRTPLSLATEHGHEAIVKLLLETEGLNPDWRRFDDRTPLSFAAERGHAEVVKILLSTGRVDVNSKDGDLFTPLFWAANSGTEAVVKVLLEFGRADVDSRDYCRDTPLSWAVYKGHETIVKMMLEMGEADMNAETFDGWLGLRSAARAGYKTVKERLSQIGLGDVSVSLGDSEEWTSNSLSILENCQVFPKLLLEKPQDQLETQMNTDSRERSLFTAARYGRGAVVRLLLETGQMGVDPKDSSRFIPLAQAERYGYGAVLTLLLGIYLRRTYVLPKVVESNHAFGSIG
ncbi:hypothetical protein N7478_006577 [Penicillium angulare]|uniref:uncharacterized protein n=1 Tax=Penicillium angulare TaxID=116970 RepID=UPI00253FD57B|nr:uncharacterized protein N7478_006577 [Penicillium angulare]KAJ5281205.1 hypothetical protein N7478_006577 [Penicillium angulare]